MYSGVQADPAGVMRHFLAGNAKWLTDSGGRHLNVSILLTKYEQNNIKVS